MYVAVTGANGFLGRALVAQLSRSGHSVRALVRSSGELPTKIEQYACGDLVRHANLDELMNGVDAVINCAARVHVTNREDPQSAEQAYFEMNCKFVERLAKAARRVGVKRIVQMSSVAAVTSSTRQLVDDTIPARPTSPYGRSKLAADQSLALISGEDMPIIALRPPALYGPSVGAYFARLMRAARYGIPLPIGAIQNRRSFAFVGNVADAVIAACESKVTGSFIVTDSEPISTAVLYDRLMQAYGHSRRSWRCSPFLVGPAARLLLGARAESLIGDAAYDGSRFAAAIGWRPKVSLDEAIVRTIAQNDVQAPD